MREFKKRLFNKYYYLYFKKTAPINIVVSKLKWLLYYKYVEL